MSRAGLTTDGILRAHRRLSTGLSDRTATWRHVVCSVVSSAGWVVVTSTMPKVGDDRVAFTVDANPDVSPRSTTIVIRDEVVRISQAGR